ncbi:MAG: ABC transporter substrate-binding protein [Thermodesulfobacteriota bacterium]
MLCWPGPARSAVEVIDDTGKKILLDRPAQRIIALYGAYNEMLAAMGMEERLIARTKVDDVPKSLLSKPSIGTHMRPNVEMVLGLKPDLIVQGAGRKEAMVAVEQLGRVGLTVAVFSPATFEELFSVILRLGTLTGAEHQSRELVESLKARLDAVRARLGTTGYRPKVFFEVRYPSLLGAGTDSIVNEVIERAGGTNCTRVNKKLVRLGIESLIESTPDFYVVQVGAMNRDPTPPDRRPHYQILEAVKRRRVLTVDEKEFSRPGPRSVDAVEKLAAFLHPEAWNRKKPQ